MAVTTSKPRGGFFIGVGCPGCGGALDLDADFFVTRCEHCGSPLRIIMPDLPPAFMIPGKVPQHEIRFHIDRHLKQNDLPLTSSTLHVKKLYYPYWKVDATVLKLRNKTEVRKLYSDSESQTETVVETDRSTVTTSPYLLTVAAGARVEGIPESIGMRSETVRIVPFSNENIADDFDALPVVRPWEMVEQKVKLAVEALSQINPADFGQNLTRLFNPSWSLIYFPYLVVESYGGSYRRFVVDGVVGRVLKALDPEAAEHPGRKPVRDRVSIGIGDVKPSFGTDSAPARSYDSFVDGVLSPGVIEDLFEIDPDMDTPFDDAPEIDLGQLNVDFHRCSVCGGDLPTELSHVYICPNCHELQIMNIGEFRLAQIEAAVFEDDRRSRLVPFWQFGLPEIMAKRFGNLLGGLDRCDKMLVPAVGASNFEALHKLTRRISAAQSRIQTGAVESLDERFLPVRIGPGEALALAEMIVCRELVDKGHKLPEGGLALEPTELGLVYIPFHLENYFYVDSVLNAVSVEKTLVE